MVHPVRPRAKRILGVIKSYHSLDSADVTNTKVAFEQCMGDIIGVYENSPTDHIFVADDGLIVSSKEGTEFIRYIDIEKVDVLCTDKRSADCIKVSKNDGSSNVLMIKHSSGAETRDVWEFWRFLDRVYKDILSRSEARGTSCESNQVEYPTVDDLRMTVSEE